MFGCSFHVLGDEEEQRISHALANQHQQQYDGHRNRHHRNRRRHRHRHHPRTRPSFASMHPVMAQALIGMREMWSPWHQHQQQEDTRGHNDDTALLLLEEDVVAGLMQPATEHPLDMMTMMTMMMMTPQHQQQPYVEAVHGPWCTDSVDDGGHEADEEDEDDDGVDVLLPMGQRHHHMQLGV
ncbi:hypothetical protein PTSG_07439 [Salpingoeca rosetta]|uniref:Uncharacterized protein n=1 Tax=Salpingoeca rosetta (strain ATCC 50818 / BSB-021) TaxID=946362 RepID=F2UIQ5_SALR5|nr:uncharacterized protein PTSG_07439 [Salpingoeca rosetta]EGD77104.1 hypothetical protein PTSG_07439 [Salpingoeca rosetta]|eukprot:XP_004990943.1 hypothetical protein PTSG_07439 [Salpingoeca rosetta]